jgi:hypothetical protein
MMVAGNKERVSVFVLVGASAAGAAAAVLFTAALVQAPVSIGLAAVAPRRNVRICMFWH